jgi:hypothetical protein
MIYIVFQRLRLALPLGHPVEYALLGLAVHPREHVCTHSRPFLDEHALETEHEVHKHPIVFQHLLVWAIRDTWVVAGGSMHTHTHTHTHIRTTGVAFLTNFFLVTNSHETSVNESTEYTLVISWITYAMPRTRLLVGLYFRSIGLKKCLYLKSSDCLASQSSSACLFHFT